MKKDKIQKLLNIGFNIMPINANKTPKQGWKKYQQEKINNLSEFRNQSEYYALICGFNDVECVDVDLKILPSKQERDEFWKELFEMMEANIDDFDKKVVIKKTQNNGYHIIYQANNIEGNLKLAKLNNSDEAIIETRGIGGYVVMYPNIIQNDYENIQFITEEERDILIGICRSFNESQEDVINVDTKTKIIYEVNNNKTPWDDYNEKTNIFDLISNDFSIVKDTAKKTFIRRNGAKSPHSGYVYKNSGCMYLFSTGTMYEPQKLITPFVAYATKNHFGDFSRAASHLYSQGFGDRKKPQVKEVIRVFEPEKQKKNEIVFPIEIFPNEIAHYMNECKRTLQNSLDYMGCAFLWACSLAIGNSLKMEVKKGWNEISTIWIAIVGEAGVGKSPSINSVLFPYDKINGEERKKYNKARKEYDIYMSLSKKEQEKVVEVEEPKRTQFIVDDVTIEALINLHSQQKNGVGVFKDELAAWFKDMNKYKEGSDKEQWLSSWSGRGISVDRISRQSDYIGKPILPVLGGIQPSILTGFYTDENRENGFLDRMLFSFPDMTIDNYKEDEIDKWLIDYYNDWMLMFYQEMRKIVAYNDFGEIEPNIVTWDEDAKTEWVRIFNDITKRQNSNRTNEMLKSMLPKQKSYIPRFALIINTINALHNSDSLLTITKESILKAEKLGNYFIDMNEKMLIQNLSNAETKKLIKQKNGSIAEKIKEIMTKKPDFNKKEVAKELNISRTTLYNYIKAIENES